MAKQTVVVTKTTISRAPSKSAGGSGKSSGNTSRCTACGKFNGKKKG